MRIRGVADSDGEIFGAIRQVEIEGLLLSGSYRLRSAIGAAERERMRLRDDRSERVRKADLLRAWRIQDCRRDVPEGLRRLQPIDRHCEIRRNRRERLGIDL